MVVITCSFNIFYFYPLTSYRTKGSWDTMGVSDINLTPVCPGGAVSTSTCLGDRGRHAHEYSCQDGRPGVDRSWCGTDTWKYKRNDLIDIVRRGSSRYSTTKYTFPSNK
jgi:hypothetical protein